MFEGFLGQALHVTRVATGQSQEEVLVKLNRLLDSNFSLSFFDGMEKDIEEIDTKTFDKWCELFPWGKVKILKCAQFLERNAHRSELELLEEAKSEIEYQLWQKEQENQ